MQETVLLEMENINKSFPGVRALTQVDFNLRAGEVHSLMGENGAGKSTLIKVLTGVYPLDEGKITLLGREVLPKSTKEAQALGISTVYQEVNLCPNLTVAENIFIGREPRKLGAISWKTMNQRANELVQKFELEVDVTKTLDNYSVAIQQMIAIVRAVDISAKVLILDEPTSSLDEQETQKLFKVIRQLKNEGIGIIFVSHFLEQIYQICDRVTVLRNGELVGTYVLQTLPKVKLVSKMIGKELEDLENFDKLSKQVKKSSESFIKAEGIADIGKINPVNMEVHKGEVVGFAGLLGSGRTETAKLLFGAQKVSAGQIEIKGKKVHLSNELEAMKQKIAFCPEDRKLEGIIGDLTVRENIIIALQAKKGIFNHLSMKEQEEIADKFIQLLKIKVSDRNQLVKNLSGGNQQKVIIARWLATNPELFILDEPTRGIDIGTKNEIQKMMVNLANEEGMSIIFISSEIDEMLRTCTKLLIFRDRYKIAELNNDGLSSTQVMATIAGGGQ